ncbi:MAG: hypothetical protein ACREIF_14810 [Chthoniobacterales bacterium]
MSCNRVSRIEKRCNAKTLFCEYVVHNRNSVPYPWLCLNSLRGAAATKGEEEHSDERIGLFGVPEIKRAAHFCTGASQADGRAARPSFWKALFFENPIVSNGSIWSLPIRVLCRLIHPAFRYTSVPARGLAVARFRSRLRNDTDYGRTTSSEQTATGEGERALVKALRKVNKLQSSENRWIYSALFFPFLATAAVLFMSLSFSFARRVLVEIATVEHLFSFIGIGILCLFLLPCFYAIAFGVLYAIANPIIGLTFVQFETFGLGSATVAASIVALFALVLALVAASTWFKILVSTVILPLTATILIWACSLLLFLVRKPLHWTLSQFLERLLSSKAGFFATCASVFAASAFLL